MIAANSSEAKLTRIGVFYDGNFFSHVSNYYNYHHERKARISISGLHQFIIEEASKAEETVRRHCRIVDAHYFRGRLSASEAQNRNALFRERVFDEVLMREGIVSHYLPLSGGGEKGIDVWMALEAFELAIYKRFDVSVLIAGDGDYLPLIRKLNTIGTRVMVLGWDFSFTDENNVERTTRTAQTLLDEATYPIVMSSIVEDRARRTNPLIENLFMKSNPRMPDTHFDIESRNVSGFIKGKIVAARDGFGFIRPDNGGDDIFFYHTDLDNIDFNDLQEGNHVSYEPGKNDRGPCARKVSIIE